MPKPLVLLTNSIDPQVEQALSAHFAVHTAVSTDAKTLRDASRLARYIVVRAPLPEDIFSVSVKLRAVVRHGAGLDMIPMPQANAEGIAVANVPAVNARSVAEYAVAQMLALARQLPQMEAALRQGDWNAPRLAAENTRDLHGKTVGIVGMGAIGMALAQICMHGFGMRVLGIQRRTLEASTLFQQSTLEAALAQADFLVLACPLNESTVHLIDASRLASAKPGLQLINVARGAVVDTNALIDALVQGRVAGAALDVHETQPLPAGSPLRRLPNVRLTPHLAGITRDSMQRMSESVMEQLLEMHAGNMPRHWCNPRSEEAIRARWARLN